MDKAPGTRAMSRRKILPGPLALLAAALLAALLVSLGAVFLLSRGLAQQNGEPLTFTPGEFKFVFGSGSLQENLLQVNAFADGYALLSSGQIDIRANGFRVLRYTWLPPRAGLEAAFFWRRADDPGNVVRTDITNPGTHLLDLSGEQDWSGKILEVGFLVAGENGKPVAVGAAALVPDSLAVRMRLTWQAWTAFEAWSQQSINFLYGGSYRHGLSLPVLAATWFVITLVLAAVLRQSGTASFKQPMLLITGGLFLAAWISLDLRWAGNNIRQLRASIETGWQASDRQRLDTGLDGELHQYVHRLKTSVLAGQDARILIVGDDSIVDYYLFRAKYHLLPHSAHVARRFTRDLPPESLDFVIFFGEPANLDKIPGWKRSWKNALVSIDQGDWGIVFRVRKQ